MKVHQVCIVVAVALSLDPRPALPQAAPAADERVERIVGAAMAGGGAHGFLQRLTDSIGGRVTGSTESRATADLLLATLRQAGFEDAHFEEYPLQSRWRQGRAAGRVVHPVNRPLAVGSYGWVPGTKGEVTASLIDLGAPASNDLPVPADRVRGAAVQDSDRGGSSAGPILSLLSSTCRPRSIWPTKFVKNWLLFHASTPPPCARFDADTRECSPMSLRKSCFSS